MTWIITAVAVVAFGALLFLISGMSIDQLEQDDCIDNHTERLEALEDYSDYIRQELYELKLQLKKERDKDNGDNPIGDKSVKVKWRKRTSRADAGHRRRTQA